MLWGEACLVSIDTGLNNSFRGFFNKKCSPEKVITTHLKWKCARWIMSVMKTKWMAFISWFSLSEVKGELTLHTSWSSHLCCTTSVLILVYSGFPCWTDFKKRKKKKKAKQIGAPKVTLAARLALFISIWPERRLIKWRAKIVVELLILSMT